MKMIDVIIPTYNAHDTIEKTLLSICLQDIRDRINVYIIDDCSEKDYDYLIDEFKDRLNINVYKLDNNSGPGVARNKGIEISNGEYIMFIDSDDLFVNSKSISALVDNMDGYDVGIGLLEYQYEDGNIYTYEHHDRCLHGKIYRRSYLDKYNIRFCPLYRHEDSAFHCLVLITNPRIYFSNNPTYVYLCNFKSLTHKKDGYEEFKNYKDLIESNEYIIDKSIENNLDLTNTVDTILCTIMYIYYCYQNYMEYDYSKELFTWIKPLVKYYLDHKDLTTEERKYQFYYNFSGNYQGILKITFDEFINKCK